MPLGTVRLWRNCLDQPSSSPEPIYRNYFRNTELPKHDLVHSSCCLPHSLQDPSPCSSKILPQTRWTKVSAWRVKRGMFCMEEKCGCVWWVFWAVTPLRDWSWAMKLHTWKKLLRVLRMNSALYWGNDKKKFRSRTDLRKLIWCWKLNTDGPGNLT